MCLPMAGPEVLAPLDRVFSTSTNDRFAATFDLADYNVADVLHIGDLEFRFAPTAHRAPC
jgi:hypothetical protein